MASLISYQMMLMIKTSVIMTLLKLDQKVMILEDTPKPQPSFAALFALNEARRYERERKQKRKRAALKNALTMFCLVSFSASCFLRVSRSSSHFVSRGQ